MKKIIYYFFGGLLLGFIFFYGAAFLFGINTAFINPIYHFIFALVIFLVYDLILKNRFNIYHFVTFFIGFGFPSLAWLIVVNLALSNLKLL